MLTNNDENSIKAGLLDSILRSTPPITWMNDTDALYEFNEVRVTARFSGPRSSDVEILNFEDLS
jgi:hypothetical protein